MDEREKLGEKRSALTATQAPHVHLCVCKDFFLVSFLIIKGSELRFILSCSRFFISYHMCSQWEMPSVLLTERGTKQTSGLTGTVQGEAASEPSPFSLHLNICNVCFSEFCRFIFNYNNFDDFRFSLEYIKTISESKKYTVNM